MTNLFSNMPDKLPAELCETLLQSESVRIERIVSTGHATPDQTWYNQSEHEWIIVLKGEAKLLFDGDDTPLDLKPGSYINIPAHRKHRVEWTSPDEPTVWLAVFYRE